MRRINKLIYILIALSAVLYAAGKFLVVSDKYDHADVIVVLSGNDTTRIEKAAQLYHKGVSENILLTNTGQTYSEYDFPYTRLQVERLKELEVPEGAIYRAEFRAKNTGQEATGIIEKMFEMSARSAVIVTEPWHTRRTKIIFSDSFANTGFQVYFTPSTAQGFPLAPENIVHTLNEYIRIIGYFIKRDTHIPDYPKLPW